MKTYKTIEIIDSGKLIVLKLNRPDKRNALNKEMIMELTAFFTDLQSNNEAVMLQIVGKGNAFCSGADIKWLNHLKDSPKEIIQQDFLLLAHLLSAMYDVPQIVVSMVHGSVFGGGLGLLACSDFVISSPGTVFSFSEINLGLIPATISPYVIEKIGYGIAKRLFFTGEKFQEDKALEIGLVDQVPKSGPSDLKYETLMETLLKKPHTALQSMKRLLRGDKNGGYYSDIQIENCRLIAELISGEETQKLFQKFLKY
jgi:methylglutaconyl-CoA hydratase